METSGETSSDKIKQLTNEFIQEKNKVEEKIAKIKREIGDSEVSPDDYGKYIQQIEEMKLKLSEIKKQKSEIIGIERQKKFFILVCKVCGIKNG